MNHVREISRGCFGTVYALRLAGLNDSVAIKTLSTANELEYQVLWAIGKARIPHTVAAISALRECGPPLLPESCPLAIAMTLVHGVTLRTYLQSASVLGVRLELPVVVRWTSQLIHFLLHLKVRLGLSHDDLKLGNVMVENGNLRVVDFTFAGRNDPAKWKCGTLCYMPPERLFGTHRPEWATLEGSDMWAVGTLLATFVLTGENLAQSVLNKNEAFHVVDEQGRFNPSRTDTVYHALSRQEPWFDAAVKRLAGESRLDEEYVEQAIRLLLWTRARTGRTDDDTFGMPESTPHRMPGLDQTPLYRLIKQFTPYLLECYDKSGSRVYEKIADLVRVRMGPVLYDTWHITQRWDPRGRGTLEECHAELKQFPPVEGGRMFLAEPTGPVHNDSRAFIADIQRAIHGK